MAGGTVTANGDGVTREQIVFSLNVLIASVRLLLAKLDADIGINDTTYAALLDQADLIADSAGILIEVIP